MSCGRRGGVDQAMGEITGGGGSMDICIADNRGSASTRRNGREKWRVQCEGERGREVEGMSRAAAASGGEAADWASGGRCRGGQFSTGLSEQRAEVESGAAGSL